MNLIDSLSNLIADFSDEKGVEFDKIFYEVDKKKEHKTALIGFLREIKEGYNKNEMTLIIKKKLTELSNIEERNYEFAIDVFLEKFKNMFSSLGENEQYLKYNYFYEDLFLTIHKLLIINNNSDLLIKIGKIYDKEVRCMITDMNTPLGYSIGNSLEVLEAIDVLKGKETLLYYSRDGN